nr:adenosylcobinamide-phosphate synthase CbiB [Halalkalibacter oceani]
MIMHLIALGMAVLIDRLVGDPRQLPHPVVGFGKLIAIGERRLNRGSGRKQKGLLMLVIVLSVVFFVSALLVWSAYMLHPVAGLLLEAWLISTTIAEKGLKQAADEVRKPLESNNLAEARHRLSYIVGRDTDKLDEAEITRATVETVAENTSDGITAPLFFAWIGGAPLALLYRAVNTCDSMVGYQNERYRDFGWASANFDDLLNWLPSRLTALVMIIANRPKLQRSSRQCWAVVRRDARKHPSPNSGWGEAAVAALLGIQLGGTNTYQGLVSNRAKMGDALERLRVVHIEGATQIMSRTVTLFTLLLLGCGGVIIVLT